jgi:phospholipase/lecithinase/hemolysin
VRFFLCFLTSLFAFANSAAAEHYDTLFVFGDSYSDMGARFLDSDGMTAVAYMAQRMGIAMTYPEDTSAKAPSLNFAASGAISGKEPGSIVRGHLWCCQGMLDQVEEFVRRLRNGSVSFDPKTTLFFIAGGLNDSHLSTENTIWNISRQISLLRETGARHITLALLPTKIPAYAAVAQRLNPAYQRLVADLRTKLHIDLQLNHWGSYFDEIIEHPALYGITNTASQCAGRALFNEDATPCQTPQTHYYFHEGHPSTAVHRIVGEKLYQEIVCGPPSRLPE